MIQVFKTHIIKTAPAIGDTTFTAKETIDNKDIAQEGFEATDTIETLDRDTYLSKRTNSYLMGIGSEGKLFLAPESMDVLDKVGFNIRKQITATAGVKSNAIRPGFDQKRYSRPILLEPSIADGVLYWRLYLRTSPKSGLGNMNTSKADYAKMEVDFDIFPVEYQGDVFTFIEAATETDVLAAFRLIADANGGIAKFFQTIAP